MPDKPQPKNQRFVAALMAVLAAHHAPTDAAGLARLTTNAGSRIHRNTLKQALAGSRLPQLGTVNKILRAIKANDFERSALLAAWEQPNAVDSQRFTRTLIDALGGPEAINRGRESEIVTWRYLVGLSDDEDFAIEERFTRVGPEGLSLASFGPAQRGPMDFLLSDYARTAASVNAEVLRTGEPAHTVPAVIHVDAVDLERQQYRMIAQFAEVSPGDTLRWVVQYRWPGIFNSLRMGGSSVGQVSMNMSGRTHVTSGSVEVLAEKATFPDLELVPLSDDGESSASSKTRGDTEYWRLKWQVDGHPTVMRFQLRCESRRDPNTRA